jgi:hypothetical protein
LTKDDILDYMGSLKKSIPEDESQKWIGTYNVRQIKTRIIVIIITIILMHIENLCHTGPEKRTATKKIIS